jgi:hypothetical protein
MVGEMVTSLWKVINFLKRVISLSLIGKYLSKNAVHTISLVTIFLKNKKDYFCGF